MNIFKTVFYAIKMKGILLLIANQVLTALPSKRLEGSLTLPLIHKESWVFLHKLFFIPFHHFLIHHFPSFVFYSSHMLRGKKKNEVSLVNFSRRKPRELRVLSQQNYTHVQTPPHTRTYALPRAETVHARTRRHRTPLVSCI